MYADLEDAGRERELLSIPLLPGYFEFRPEATVFREQMVFPSANTGSEDPILFRRGGNIQLLGLSVYPRNLRE